MSDDLLGYYDRELGYFRRMSGEFARSHPKIAGRLRLGSESGEDPHVERLIEGVAYLNARIRQKLDDDFPELTQGLLGVLYPHFLAPIPSMTVVDFELGPDSMDLTSGYRIEQGSTLETETIDGEPCRFRTTHEVKLWPMTARELTLRPRPFTAPETVRTSAATSLLHLRLQTLDDDTPISALDCSRVRGFPRGPSSATYPLHELLSNHVVEAVLASGDRSGAPLVLGPEAVRSIGYDPAETLLPSDPRVPQGYQMLTEFFAFPRKHLFFEFDLPLNRLSGDCSTADLFVYLDRSVPNLEQSLNRDGMTFGSVPAVNLFPQMAEPISVSGRTYEQRVVPDARRPQATEIYSIESVVGTRYDGEEVEYHPFFAIDGKQGRRPEDIYWHAVRRPAVSAGGSVDRGTELFLSLTDLSRDLVEQSGTTLEIRTLCTNRDLPGRLPFGGDQPGLKFTEGQSAVERIRCLTPPTLTRRRLTEETDLWQLISHLSLNHLPLTGGDDGVRGMREMLHLYNADDSESSTALINSLLRIESGSTVARVPGDRRGGICRGIRIDLIFRREGFSEKGAFFLASVLERFFSVMCSLNSFTRTRVFVDGRERPVKTWPPRIGERILL